MEKRSDGLKEAMIKMVKEMGEVGAMVACMVDESAGMGWGQGAETEEIDEGRMDE